MKPEGAGGSMVGQWGPPAPTVQTKQSIPPMEQFRQTHVEPILSIQETVALMAKRPGITVGGGIERSTPNPDPKAAEPPTDEDDVVANFRITEWWDRKREVDKVAEMHRKKVCVPGERYQRPRIWTPEERANLMAWRKQYGETAGTATSGRRVTPPASYSQR